MSKLTIVHANELVEASYSLSIDELRIIALASTKVDSRKKNIGEIRIDVSEFKEAYGLAHGRVYSDLRDAVKSIMRKPIRLFDGKEVLELAWLSSNRYRIDDGSHVIIEFSPKVEPYLFEMKERFTAINFEHAARLNTPFSFRLYQWLYKAKKLNKNKKGEVVEVIFEVDWMKSQTALIGEYERWEAFKRKVLTPAVEKINANTDLSVIYKPIKTGRKVTAVKFTYVVEVGSIEKPLRPRLARRPKVLKGSHEEGVWMRKNLALLLDYEAKLKAYDAEAKLTLPDLRKMAEYASIAEPELQQRLKKEIEERTTKKAA
ncbi:replication initiation protein [Vibrio alginolyticus]|uniref:replication initiation protein n=1 Tax=Vibrio TaxID=662 RepID=UPI001CDCFB7D|nr:MULTISPECIES: replication initiation protein [Vibrio]MCA2494100.1 replication initiation protein [Vibrio alginolyticus]MCG6307029.1 replication initiation protein [Vibrio alginolyticus]MDW2221200.1 replication initiation protein [Vibrio sp. 2175-1]